MLWVALLASSTIGLAQDTPAADPGLVIRSTTSLVQVRVVAEDARGRPVTGLEREDFQVQDDRKPQPITLFSAGPGDASPPSVPPSAGESAPVQRAGEYSLILLDWLNTNYADRYNSQQHLLHLLQSYQTRRRVAVYLLAGKPRLIHDFTADMAELARAVEDAGLEPADMGPDSAPGRFDARYGARTGPPPGAEEQLFFLNNRVNDSFQTLELMADRLTRLPGRKSLVWLTAAFPLLLRGGASYYQNMERLLAHLNRGDVAVYPVDARGLTISSTGYPGTMEQLSERTGGVTFSGRNDIDAGIRAALEDMRVSYILGFHVPAGAAPGLHEIRVKVSRPGVRLRYRESYQLAPPAPVR
jgi:VWFA-related protein